MRASAVRLAALGACALIPLAAQAAQLRAGGLKAPSKDAPMLLEADEVVYDSEAKTVSAVGHVEITDDGRILLAERVDYDQASDKVTARGHVSITDDKGNVAFADHVVLTDHMRDGALSGLRRPDRQDRAAGRQERPAHQRHHRDRPPHRLFALQDLQPARPAHAAVAGQGRARGL